MATVAVTGLNGFVGTAIATELERRGHRCISLGRSQPMTHAREWRQYALGAPIAASLLDGCDALVHCAHDMIETRQAEAYQRNVSGSIELFELAARKGLRLVYLSSMSAYDGTAQIYGRSKLECERAVADFGGVSLRLGLVFSEDARGMVGALRRLTALSVVPLIAGRSYQYVVQRADAACAVALAVEDESLVGTLGVANPQRVVVRTLIASIAARAGHSPRFVPVPWPLVYAAMRVVEAVGGRLPFRSDSVLGLARPAKEVIRLEEWTQRGLSFEPFRTAEISRPIPG